MVDCTSRQTVDGSRWHGEWVKPIYDTFGFAQIPALIRELFSPQPQSPIAHRLLGLLEARYDKVVVCLVDAFGWRFFEQYHSRYPFLDRFTRDGTVTKLTSQFPSATAPHVTTMHTGLPIGRHGVCEWYYYSPLLDEVIAPLMFCLAGDGEANTLARRGIDPATLFPRNTQYQALQELGVTSYVLQHRDFTPSPYGDVVCAGATVVPFRDSADGIARLSALVAAAASPAYFYLHLGSIDTAGHRYGLNSRQFSLAVDTTFTQLEALFHTQAGGLRNTLFLLTADHGMIDVEPARTIYLNRVAQDLTAWLRVNRRGMPIVPVGAPRDMFLHVRDEHLQDAQRYLRDRLQGVAEVRLLGDLLQRGFFGPMDHPALLRAALGNLAILPEAGECVWWYEKGRFAQGSFAFHGGFTPEEMETQLLAYAYA